VKKTFQMHIFYFVGRDLWVLGERKVHTGIWFGSLRKIGHFEYLGLDIRIILKRVLRLMSGCALDPCGLREVCVAGRFEQDSGLRRS